MTIEDRGESVSKKCSVTATVSSRDKTTILECDSQLLIKTFPCMVLEFFKLLDHRNRLLQNRGQNEIDVKEFLIKKY